MSVLVKGDRVLINTGVHSGVEGTVVGYAGSALQVRRDNQAEGNIGNMWVYEADRLMKIAPTPQSEREKLVEVAREAVAKRADKLHARNMARKAYDEAEQDVQDAQRALRDYDEAHREPTFPEKLRAMGFGATIQNNSTKTVFVKTGDKFVSNKTGGSYYPGDFYDHGDMYTILSEGVAV